MEGHILSSTISKNKDSKFEIDEINMPAITLLISGGHTELVLIEKLGKYKIIGNTRDDAVGEAFDKVARMMGLRYPGGPEISKLAEEARKENVIIPNELELPRPMINSKDLDFSFSGLKTAVLTRIKNLGGLTENKKKTLALSFEEAVTDVLISKTKSAIEKYNAKSLIIGGGVSANKYIRENLKRLAKEENFSIFLPEKNMSTDNALMIAIVSALKIKNGVTPSKNIKATGNQKIDSV
jgi:N6-L-threonylcarbamoyladenine synthase